MAQVVGTKKTQFRHKQESLIDCGRHCKAVGAFVLAYRNDIGDCACCYDDPIIIKCANCTLYTLPGMNILGFS